MTTKAKASGARASSFQPVMERAPQLVGKRKTPVEPVPQGFPMADCSQVWIPRPDGWPQPTPEEMAKDARRRAAFYTTSKFWNRSTRNLVLGPKVQKGLFDA